MKIKSLVAKRNGLAGLMIQGDPGELEIEHADLSENGIAGVLINDGHSLQEFLGLRSGVDPKDLIPLLQSLKDMGSIDRRAHLADEVRQKKWQDRILNVSTFIANMATIAGSPQLNTFIAYLSTL
ncbi:MAG: hypothetical protein IPM46_16520 [Flavobacteriales bacterium]|nr:hypothetical protein [Flavobacteriales bacterium]